MGGLLGGYNPDPMGQGLLGLGAALMTPRAMGGGVGPGLMAFNSQMQQAQMQRAQMQRQAQQDEMRRQLQTAQIGEYGAQADERKMRADAMRQRGVQEAQQREAQQSVLGGLRAPPPGFRDASIAAGGTAPAGYQAPGAAPPITRDVAVRWLAAGGDLNHLKQLAESGDYGRREVARVMERRGADNTPEQVMTDKFGGQVGAAVPKPFEMKMQDLGGSVVPVNPFAPTTMQKTMTPGDMQSAADSAAGRGVTMRGQNMTNARAMESNARAMEAKADKPPSEGQAQNFLFASRADAADKIIVGLKDPSIVGSSINSSLRAFPVIGGAMGTGQNVLLGDDTQKYMQAKRDFINAVLRKESGAVIGPDEFVSNDLQYFPQPFDGEAVKKQKAENRRRAIEGISAGAGPLQSRIGSAPQGAPANNDPLGLR